MSKPKNCARCLYFHLVEARKGHVLQGQCRRFPPVPMIIEQPGTVLNTSQRVGMAGISPPVDIEFCCGEFKRADRPTAAIDFPDGKAANEDSA